MAEPRTFWPSAIHWNCTRIGAAVENTSQLSSRLSTYSTAVFTLAGVAASYDTVKVAGRPRANRCALTSGTTRSGVILTRGEWMGAQGTEGATAMYGSSVLWVPLCERAGRCDGRHRQHYEEHAHRAGGWEQLSRAMNCHALSSDVCLKKLPKSGYTAADFAICTKDASCRKKVVQSSIYRAEEDSSRCRIKRKLLYTPALSVPSPRSPARKR